MANTAHYNVTAAPTLIYSPATLGTPVAFIYNEGSVPVYLGQANVTVKNGTLLQPGDHHRAVNANVPLYACTAILSTTSLGQATSAAVNSGGTTLTAAIAFNAAANGSLILVGSSATATDAEVVTLVSGGGSTTLTVTALQYDHRTAITPAIVTGQVGQLKVDYGTG